MKKKQIQISEDMFINVCKLIEQLKKGEYDTKLTDEIEKGITEKLDTIKKREFYEKSKKAGTEEEREEARLEYLKMSNIQENFKW